MMIFKKAEMDGLESTKEFKGFCHNLYDPTHVLMMILEEVQSIFREQASCTLIVSVERIRDGVSITAGNPSLSLKQVGVMNDAIADKLLALSETLGYENLLHFPCVFTAEINQ